MRIILEEWNLAENSETGVHLLVFGVAHIDAYCSFLIFCIKKYGRDFHYKLVHDKFHTVICVGDDIAYRVIADEFVGQETYHLYDDSPDSNFFLYN